MLREWLVRLWATLHRRRTDADMQAELRAHVALAEEYGRRDPHAARHLAQAMDALRDQRGLPWLEQLLQDTRYGLRGLRRTPMFTAVAVLSLALGVGANTALFSLVDDLLLRSLPIRDPDRLVQVKQGIVVTSKARKASPVFAPPMFDEVRALGLFSEVTGFMPMDRPDVTFDGALEPPRQVERVPPGFFVDLGIQPIVGRAPQIGDAESAVISYRLWRARFGGSVDVLGRGVSVNGRPYSIAAVAPARFHGLAIDAPADIWISSPDPAPLQMIARLKGGVSIQQAGAAAEALFRRHAAEIPAPPDMIRAELVPAGKGLSGLRAQYERPLQALTVLVMLVLVLTCSNVGSLLMVRNAGRRRDMTVRVALGASRWRLMRQYLVESALLAALSGTLAVAVARWGVGIFLSLLPLASAPASLAFDTDARVLGFVAVVSLVSALLFGLAPAWRASRVDVANDVRAGQGSTAAPGTRRLGRVLVGCQVAVSVLLLVAAGLFVRTLRNLHDVDVGFNTERLMQVLIDTRGAGFNRGQVAPVYRLLLERVSAVPDVRSVTAVRNPVLRGAGSIMFTDLPGMIQVERGETWQAAAVGPSFFETMGIPLRRGRTFTPADFDDDAPKYVANEAFLRRYFPGTDPVGSGPIVGVVGDARLAGVRADMVPMLFERIRRDPDRINALEVRTSADPQVVAAAIRQTIRRIHPRLLIEVNTMQAEIERQIATERMVASVSAFFSLLGVVLAAIGIFGVASYTVAQRTNELGLRMALGAGRGRVIVESLRDTMLVFTLGLGAGVLAAVLAVRVAAGTIAGLLFGVTPGDTLTIAAAAAAMVVVAAAACAIPAKRATGIDPLAAIRYQ